MNFNNETITIVVEDLDFGPGPLVVRLGDESGFGDITSGCVDDLISNPQTLTCDFSAAGLGTGLPPDGDYLVNVATGDGQSQSDEYDLTIAEVVLPESADNTNTLALCNLYEATGLAIPEYLRAVVRIVSIILTLMKL